MKGRLARVKGKIACGSLSCTRVHTCTVRPVHSSHPALHPLDNTLQRLVATSIVIARSRPAAAAFHRETPRDIPAGAVDSLAGRARAAVVVVVVVTRGAAAAATQSTGRRIGRVRVLLIAHIAARLGLASACHEGRTRGGEATAHDRDIDASGTRCAALPNSASARLALGLVAGLEPLAPDTAATSRVCSLLVGGTEHCCISITCIPRVGWPARAKDSLDGNDARHCAPTASHRSVSPLIHSGRLSKQAARSVGPPPCSSLPRRKPRPQPPFDGGDSAPPCA